MRWCRATSTGWPSTVDAGPGQGEGDAALGPSGPVGLAATAGYIKSGRVLDASTPQRAQQYNDVGVADFGLSVTAYGVNVFGNYQVGQQGSAGSWGPSPKNTDGPPWL